MAATGFIDGLVDLVTNGPAPASTGLQPLPVSLEEIQAGTAQLQASLAAHQAANSLPTPPIPPANPDDSTLPVPPIPPSATPNSASTPAATSSATPASAPAMSSNDFRVRLSPLPAAQNQVLGGAQTASNVLAPLYSTNGLMFPYTPQIQMQQTVDYRPIDLVHTNSDILAYSRTPSVTISVNGKFTIQNQQEGAYVLACIHFLRVVSKMYFGDNYTDSNGVAGNSPTGSSNSAAGGAASTNKYKGLPPPVLILSGYGSYMFGNSPQTGLRVILKSHSYSFDSQMDTVLISTAGGTCRLPVMFEISTELVVQQTPRALRKDFDLGKFRTGQLMTSKGGWI